MNQPQDAIPNSWIEKAPQSLLPYLQLSRFDRPAGFWLLGLPCFMGQALGRIGEGFSLYDIFLSLLWVLGAIAMRGAGCTINDLADKDFDAQVERTKGRPLPSGRINTKQAILWLVAQLILGLLVLLCLPHPAQIVALLSLPMVVAYPFMKRITWWPQAWLGMTFNWGILVGFAAVDSINIGTFLLWFGGICWTLGYDTIYAMSDMEDDALIGVKSSARKLGAEAPMWVGRFYSTALALFTLAALYEASPKFAFVAAIPALIMLGIDFSKQYSALAKGDADYNKIFRSNKKSGILIVIAYFCVVLANWALETWVIWP